MSGNLLNASITGSLKNKAVIQTGKAKMQITQFGQTAPN